MVCLDKEKVRQKKKEKVKNLPSMADRKEFFGEINSNFLPTSLETDTHFFVQSSTQMRSQNSQKTIL